MISILIPTRKRRAGLERTVRSALSMADNRDCLEFVAYVDEDDSTYTNFNEEFNLNVRFLIGPRIVLSNMWNKCAAAAVGEILCQGNDDIVFRTPGWDGMVYSAFANYPDKILLAHGSDGTVRPSGSEGKFGCHPFISRRWIETVGYFTAPFFSSDYGDTWLNDLADAIGRRRYLPFVVEHMHFWLGKGPQDETSNDRLARHSIDNVAQLYQDLAPFREVDIEKLKAAMNEH